MRKLGCAKICYLIDSNMCCVSRRVWTSCSGTGGVGMETVSMLVGDRQLTQVASNLKN